MGNKWLVLILITISSYGQNFYFKTDSIKINHYKKNKITFDTTIVNITNFQFNKDKIELLCDNRRYLFIIVSQSKFSGKFTYQVVDENNLLYQLDHDLMNLIITFENYKEEKVRLNYKIILAKIL